MTSSQVFARIAVLGFGAAYAPAAFAQVPPVPPVAAIEALCPGQSGNPMQFGTAEESMDAATLSVVRVQAQAAGFEKVETRFTAWSDKLLGIELGRDVPDGAALDQWGDDFHDQITAAGWTVGEEPFMAGYQTRYEKVFAGNAQPRRLAIEVSLHGISRGVTLLCADAALQLEDQNETDGVLAEGSPRPTRPPPQPKLDEFLARLDCEDPELLGAFAKALNLEDAAALVETRLTPEEVTAQADYQYKLVTWLRWKLRGSGAIDEDTLWGIEEDVREQHPLNFEEDLFAMARIVEEVTEAEKAKDPAKLCGGYKGMVAYLFAQSAREERRHAALAAAFEAEAQRRSLSLD